MDALHSAPSFAMGFAHFIAQFDIPFWTPLTLAGIPLVSRTIRDRPLIHGDRGFNSRSLWFV